MALCRRVYFPVVALAGTFLLVGSPGERQPNSAHQSGGSPLEWRLRGGAAFRAGSYREAARIYQAAYELAVRNHDTDSAIQLGNNLGGTYSAMFQYRPAIAYYLQAKRLAELHRKSLLVAGIAINLTSLYLTLGDLSTAEKTAHQALKTVDTLQSSGHPDTLGYYQLYSCLGWIAEYQQRHQEAILYYQKAIWAADRAGNVSALTKAWDHLGEQMLFSGQQAAAEAALIEGFRLRTLFHDRDVRISLIKLAGLRLDQGDLRSATALLDRADATPGADVGLPAWIVGHLRGRILERTGKTREAIPVFREALAAARSWQREAAPAGIPALYAQRKLDELYRDFASASLETDRDLSLGALEATEQDRTAAFEQMQACSRTWREKRGPDYWAIAANLRTARGEDLSHGSPETRQRVESLRQKLLDLQLRADQTSERTSNTTYTENNSASGTLRNIQGGLMRDEALFSFHVGDRASAMWAITRDHVEIYHLPSREILTKLVHRFKAAVQHPDPSTDRDLLGQELYSQLFGSLSVNFTKRAAWIITAEDTFFDVPFSALVVELLGRRPVYLVERHMLMQTPSAILNSQPAPAPGTTFVGVADGIYNSADSRWRRIRFAVWSKPTLQIARLASSRQEIVACERAWGSGQAVLLTGPSADRLNLEMALKTRPAVIHVATHVLAPENQPNEAVIDLGLTPQGQPELLTKEDIEAFDVPGATVVMSGCSSGANESIPTAGVLGLMRAWLIAGARVIVGSRWPTPDDTGELFRSFYSNLRMRGLDSSRLRAAAASMQTAQLEMLRSQTWRSDPKYWSAFYVFGKE